MSSPPARLLFSPWLAGTSRDQACQKEGKTRCSPIRGDRHRINWAAGHGHSQGIGRAGQGLEMHWMEVTLAVTNRCSSCPVVSRRPCHAVSVWPVWLSCSAPNAVIEPQLHCSARICKSMGGEIDCRRRVDGRPSLGFGAAWKPPGLCRESSEMRPVSRTFWVCSSLVRGNPRKGLD